MKIFLGQDHRTEKSSLPLVAHGVWFLLCKSPLLLRRVGDKHTGLKGTVRSVKVRVERGERTRKIHLVALFVCRSVGGHDRLDHPHPLLSNLPPGFDPWEGVACVLFTCHGRSHPKRTMALKTEGFKMFSLPLRDSIFAIFWHNVTERTYRFDNAQVRVIVEREEVQLLWSWEHYYTFYSLEKLK